MCIYRYIINIHNTYAYIMQTKLLFWMNNPLKALVMIETDGNYYCLFISDTVGSYFIFRFCSFQSALTTLTKNIIILASTPADDKMLFILNKHCSCVVCCFKCSKLFKVANYD